MIKYKCTHDWDIDYSTMLLSDPPQRNATCKKCGEKTTKFVTGPAPTTTTGENGNIGINGPVSAKQWIPPVGEICLAKCMDGFHIKTKPLFIGKEKFIAQDLDNGVEFTGSIENWVFEPIPKKKIVDMSLFAGTDFLLRSKITGFSNLTSDLSVCHLHKYTPYIDHPNAVKGLTKEPKYLKPFKYTVLESHVTYHNDVKGETRNQNHRLDWPNIFHITILGLKDGWEYEG